MAMIQICYAFPPTLGPATGKNGKNRLCPDFEIKIYRFI
jgi:hypothetical protein